MNSIDSVLSGLLSSLLLSSGFRQLAARFDPLHDSTVDSDTATSARDLSAVACSPCRLSAVACSPCRLQGA